MLRETDFLLIEQNLFVYLIHIHTIIDLMESTRQAVQSSIQKQIRHTESNVFSKSVHSRLYENFHLQNTTALSQQRLYDSQYKNGFPKLYSLDTSVQNNSGINLEQKSKYSFRNQNSRVIEDSNLLQKNMLLKSDIARLIAQLQSQRKATISRSEYERVTLLVSSNQTEIISLQGLLEVERRNNSNKAQVQRLSALLNSRDNEIRRLQQRISLLERQGIQPQSNQWQVKFNESQIFISQLHLQINSLNQQLNQFSNQYSTQVNQLNIKISQYTARITQLENAQPVQKADPQVSIFQSRIERYQLQIEQLNTTISRYTTRISQLERAQSVTKADPQVGVLQSRIERYQLQIEQLNYHIHQYEVQISQYESRFSQYESQITTLQQTNWKLEERVEKVIPSASLVKPTTGVVDDEKWVVSQGKLNFRIIILLQEINRMKQKETELSSKSQQLHAYLLKAQNYIEQIQVELQKNNLKENVPSHIVDKVTRIEEQNRKYNLLIQELQSRLASFKSQGIQQDDHYAEIGERDLRIIILLEQINRLNQRIFQIRSYLERAQDYIGQLQQGLKNQDNIIPAQIENQLIYLNEQNHRLNVIIENYITEIKSLRISITQLQTRSSVQNVQVKTEYKIPPQVQTKLAFLAQENERLNNLIMELQNHPVETQTEYKVPIQIETKVSFLTQYNERLNRLVIELQSRPALKAQTIIPDNQQLQENYARLQLKSIVLLEQINRLNYALREVRSFLVDAQNYIEEIDVRNRQVNNQSQQVEMRVEARVQFRVPVEVAAELAKFTLRTIILLEEISRLNYLVRQVQGYLINAETYIEKCQIKINQLSQSSRTNQYSILPQVQARIVFLNQENQRLNNLVLEIQARPAIFQTRIEQKIEFRTSPQIQARIALLASENERLKADLTRVSSTQNVSNPENHLVAEYGRLQLRLLILLEQINRLNFLTEQLRQYLINAQNHIFELQNRPQRGGISLETQSKITFLSEQNARLILEINKITITYEQQINHYKTEITSYTSQITNFVTQINNYKTEINNFNVKITQIESRSGSGQLSLEINTKMTFLTPQNQRPTELSSQASTQQLISAAKSKQSVQHLRVIILLQQINRLNSKLSHTSTQRTQVIEQLIMAQSYIQQLITRYSQLQLSTKQSSITTNTFSGSNRAIQELNLQLMDLQSKNKTQVAERNLRIIFLLEEINRLNNKQAGMMASLGGSGREIESCGQLLSLRGEKQVCERELQQVLDHLRQAEEYIGELLRQNEGFARQREQLIYQLNSLQHR